MTTLLAMLLAATPTAPATPPMPVSKGGTGASSLPCTSGQVLSSDGGRFFCTSATGAVSTGAPIYIDGGRVLCAPAAENTPGCIAGNSAAVQDLSGIFVFKQRLATRGGTTYDAPTALTASMDVSEGIAVDGPIFPNTDGDQLRLTGRRTDQVSGIRLEAQRWVDGGIIADVAFPWPCNNSGSVMAWKPEGTVFGGDSDRSCSGTGSLTNGALWDNGGVAGHYSMIAGNPLSLAFAGNLSANLAYLPDGGRPYNDGGDPTICTLADGGDYFCYAGRHGAVIATTRERMKQGLLFQADNVDRPEGNHVFYVTHWGSFGQDDKIPFSSFPPAAAQNIPTTGGQYITGFAGELAHDSVQLGDYTTGKWRSRETLPDGGPAWTTLLTDYAPIPTTQLSGTVADAQLASSYSGVGACGASAWASTLNDNAAPTCSQPGFSNISGTAAVSQGGTGAAPGVADQVLVSTSTSAATWRTLPSCSDGVTEKLLYNSSTDTFSCGTDQGGGSGAPTDATYWTGSANASLSAEHNLGALGTGLVLNTGGTPSAYAGTTCTNQFARSLNASGAATCASVAIADHSATGTPDSTTFLRGDNTWATPSSTLYTSRLSGDVSVTVNASYVTVFTYSPAASKNHYLYFSLMHAASAASVGMQYRVRSADTGNTGVCVFTTYGISGTAASATANETDIIAIASSPADTAAAASCAATATLCPVDIICTFASDGTPGDVILEVQLETGTANSPVKAGSYYTAVTN